MKYNKLTCILIFSAILLTVRQGIGNPTFNPFDDQGSFKLPDYEKFVMNNGLIVYLMEQHEVPLLSVSLVIPAGAIKDDGKYGLASLTADALLFGTKNYTKTQIEEILDFHGVTYGTSASSEVATIRMSLLNDD